VAPLEVPWGGFRLSGAARELGREGFRACRLPKAVTAAVDSD
jgi:acyl-CoA reductase-like NAD-dependent aldehyde dehydrogenase